MRILHINYNFYPLVNAQSTRWVKFCNYLASHGHKVDVLSIRPSTHCGSYQADSHKDISPLLQIYRTHPGFLHYLLLHVRGCSVPHTQKTTQNKHKRYTSLLSRFALHIWRKYIQHILVPDRAIDWLPIALLRGSILSKNNHYDCIISSSPFHTNHIVAYLLSRLFPRMAWIADYGDPWSTYTYPTRSRGLAFIHRNIERTVLKRVRAISVTTDETRKLYLNSFSYLSRNQVITIPQGVDTAIIKGLPTDQRSRFTLGYFGRFDPIREPACLFHALKLLEEQGFDYEFLIVGPLQDEYVQLAKSLHLGINVRFLGQQPHATALRLAKSCHAVVYVGNISPYQLPGKIFEYIALRKPILCIKAINEDIGARLISELKRGIVCGNDPLLIADSIRELRYCWQGENFSREFNLDEIAGLDWDFRGQQYSQILDCIERGL